jgi:hypothetical protein
MTISDLSSNAPSKVPAAGDYRGRGAPAQAPEAAQGGLLGGVVEVPATISASAVIANS